jgi:hypothetical protein
MSLFRFALKCTLIKCSDYDDDNDDGDFELLCTLLPSVTIDWKFQSIRTFQASINPLDGAKYLDGTIA